MALAPWTALTAAVTSTLLAAAPLVPVPAGPLPPPPPPGTPPGGMLSPGAPGTDRPATAPTALRRGTLLRLQGRPQQAAWEWLDGNSSAPGQLWLPLEVLVNQLGFSSRSRPDGSLDLEWFGRRLLVPPAAQRPLADEVAVEVAPLLQASGLRLTLRGDALEIDGAPARLLGVRQARQAGLRRVVLDLDGPALVRSDDGGLRLALLGTPEQLGRLEELGLRGRQSGSELVLAGVAAPPQRVFTLGTPARVVIELPAEPATQQERQAEPPPIDPRLQALLGPQLQWERQVRTVAGGRVLVTSVRLDPRTSPLALRPLRRQDGMEGLSSLGQLARGRDALVAINGGYFNRVRRLPLGALREDGRWLSGPILGRGAIGWEPRSLPRFGRLSLQESLVDRDGRVWPLIALNSGWVQRGLSRYTADWGPVYRPLSDGEQGMLLRDGVVQERIDPARLQGGVRLADSTVLVVARGGAPLPWGEAEPLALRSAVSDPLGEASQVMGGGPLLLLDGRIVLDGGREGFSPVFLRQGAPRTVIGSDGSRLWLITLQGVDDAGPSLSETAQLLAALGLRDALNLDGGSSTGLVMGGAHTVKGRGVAGSVHNGLGLVLEPGSATPGG
ncbi:MAG: phosphodiester glycosidase family protein [Synechococcaceae cyanobacterium]|nr:phosphodiester glycosidase family protein [Synechococcaceae cyanobacterium]